MSAFELKAHLTRQQRWQECRPACRELAKDGLSLVGELVEGEQPLLDFAHKGLECPPLREGEEEEEVVVVVEEEEEEESGGEQRREEERRRREKVRGEERRSHAWRGQG